MGPVTLDLLGPSNWGETLLRLATYCRASYLGKGKPGQRCLSLQDLDRVAAAFHKHLRTFDKLFWHAMHLVVDHKALDTCIRGAARDAIRRQLKALVFEESAAFTVPDEVIAGHFLAFGASAASAARGARYISTACKAWATAVVTRAARLDVCTEDAHQAILSLVVATALPPVTTVFDWWSRLTAAQRADRLSVPRSEVEARPLCPDLTPLVRSLQANRDPILAWDAATGRFGYKPTILAQASPMEFITKVCPVLRKPDSGARGLVLLALQGRVVEVTDEEDQAAEALRNKRRTELVQDRRCSNPACGRQEAVVHSFLLCGRCRAVRYCGKQCQREHWAAGHKQACSAP